MSSSQLGGSYSGCWQLQRVSSGRFAVGWCLYWGRWCGCSPPRLGGGRSAWRDRILMGLMRLRKTDTDDWKIGGVVLHRNVLWMLDFTNSPRSETWKCIAVQCGHAAVDWCLSWYAHSELYHNYGTRNTAPIRWFSRLSPASFLQGTPVNGLRVRPLNG